MSRFTNAIALVTTVAAVVLLSFMFRAMATKSSTAENISVAIRPARPRRAAAADVVSQAAGPGYGSVSGRIVFDGEIPELPPIVRKEQMRDGDGEICDPAEIPNESLIVDRETHGIANVFVYLPKATHGIHPDLQRSSEKWVDCEMKGCRYVPHALLARTDQVVAVRAVDDCPHNFVERARRNEWFQDNPFTSPGAPPIERRHQHPESMPIQVACDNGMPHLKELPMLELLCLRQTHVTDAGLPHLQHLPRLKEVLLASTRVTDNGVSDLKHAMPHLTVDK